ncbi:branched-chain amino acid ABC transporter permease [Xanthobacter aminoxidans]|jgi:branched-chain amino acid transport system permease protein|uniref:Branched-chain amino acid ABC transporter permease n=1 Tax=Xanthobacter flavus TaxID=281 RepID=A0A9W6FKR6_XANFL|nr:MULTISPECIES: branched-chain amino acid ABC transporter permease [Xanthobacter]MDR6335387.1 branched-chain amino acid transport system permease protein [Xanthobacter flavus]NMN58712.1 branched-chain amino acid transport system permease protein [Xanthobacter sp. SG618]UDQ87447.1 branched-chain amino acid ABC transporter permease [Xanthobacter autotrophicus]GLI24059.1 branched-chain amino acid ABC transporter permease [Xanthobacter flavus]
MNVLSQLIVSGIAVGMIYGVIAFSYQLTFATSKTLNFGQGEALMLGALVGLTTINFLIGQAIGTLWAYLLMLPIVFAFGLAQGAVVEWLGVRQAVKAKSEAGWIMATIALGIIFRNLAENIWGRDALRFPSPLPEAALTIGPVRIQPMEIAIVIGALAIMLAVEIFNRRSIFGKAVVATANDRDAAGLMGIDTRRVITFSYALSSMTAAFAGVLIAPVTLTGATMGAVLGLKAFAVAIIGGLSSGMGVIVGGLILGITETLTGYYISTGYKDVPGLVLLLLVLSLKPSGLFGRATIKKV